MGEATTRTESLLELRPLSRRKRWVVLGQDEA